jgi:hypothetical protein
VIRAGLGLGDTKPVAACSNQYHGIDVLVLRAASHPKTAVVEWGDPTELKAGDELYSLPRREIHPTPERQRFVHINLVEWTKTAWSSEWRNVMVAEGFGKPGFSGSPWVRDGKVYGLHKGRVQPRNQQNWYSVAETTTRVKQCLATLSYEHLVPPD